MDLVLCVLVSAGWAWAQQPHAHYKGQGNAEDANNFECR